MRKLIQLAFLLLISKISYSQITVAAATPQQGLDALIGGNVSYTFVSSQGNANQFGIFNGTASNIGFNSGMVLSTAAINPPNGFAPPQALGGAGSAGYAPLGNLVGGSNTNNAAVVTFQFTPIGDTMQFRYVFASNEYPGFVCSGFNDVFAFFLSGPNPAGGNYVNNNIALIPGTTTPVTINNVNAGNNFGACNPPGGGPACPCNQQFFVNNYAPAGNTVNIAGFTTPLTAMAPVIPCSTYTITLAVADVLDGSLNSAVFLEANSFISPAITINPTASIGGVDTVLYEGCSFAEIDILRNYELNLPHTYNLQISGTAIDGTDYTGVPQTVTFAPGDSIETITLNTIYNPNSNANSQVIITIQDTVCASAAGVITSVLILDIINVDTLQVDIGPDLISCDTINIQSVVTGGLAPYTYSWNNGQYTTPNVTNHILAGNETFVLVVDDNCNHSNSDTLTARIIEPPTAFFDITASATKVNEECGTVQVTITRQGQVNQARVYPLFFTGTATLNTDYAAPPMFGFAANQTVTQFTITPVWDGLTEGTEYITVTTVDTLCNGSTVRDSVRINIINIDAPSVNAGPDISTGCPILPQNLMPVPTGGTTPYTWQWASGETVQGITVQPATSTNYTVTMTDSCGNTATDEILVETFYPPVAEFSFASADWCEPATVVFTNTSQSVSGDLMNYDWNFGNGTSNSPDPTQVYMNDGAYTVTLIVTNSFGCTDTTTQTLEVRPKPEANFYWEPNNPSVNNPNVNFFDNSTGGASGWLWQVDGLYTATEQNPSFNFNIAGEYAITLYVNNEWGCKDTVDRTMIVTGVSTMYIPSAFTPSNDNLNETFKPQLTNILAFNMQIYDRWGELLYSTQDTHDKGWSGRAANGKLLKTDVYVYKIYAKDIYGKEFEYYGHVNLIGDM